MRTIQTYVEKDVTELSNVRDTRQFWQSLGLCAGRAGQLLNISALANACDIAFNTAKAWLSILESSYLVFLLQPYHQNRNKRLVKTPKLYFSDTSLLCHLLGIKTAKQLETDRLKGGVFENMMIAEYQKRNFHLYEHHDFSFWQDSSGKEIDLLRQEGRAYNAITNELFKQLDKFEAQAQVTIPVLIRKILVYGGNDNQRLPITKLKAGGRRPRAAIVDVARSCRFVSCIRWVARFYSYLMSSLAYDIISSSHYNRLTAWFVVR